MPLLPYYQTGQIIRAKDDEGNVATQNTINKLAAAGQKFGGQIYSSTGDIHNTSDGKQVVKVFNATTGKPQWTDIDSGEQWKGKGNPQPQSIATQMAKMDYGVISDYRKKFGTDKLAAVDQARKDGIIKSPSDEAAFLDRWNFAGGVPGFGAPGAAITAPAGTAPPPLTMPGQTPPPAAAGAAAPTSTGQRPPPAAAGQRPAQAAPGGGGGAHSVRGQNEPETVYQERLKRESAVAEAAAKERIQTSESIPREFIKLNTKAASDAAAASANAPQLLSTIDRIGKTLEQRPDFANSLQSPAFTAFVVAQESEKQKRLEDLSNAARIRPQDKTEFQNLVNDLRKLEVAGITQSGLTASQLNTERESQRVIDALAANLRNTPQAARTQVEIARAQILYNQRFARYLANADPTKNPALLRSQFDDTVGDKIYQDLAPKLEAIRRSGGVVDFRSNQ